MLNLSVLLMSIVGNLVLGAVTYRANPKSRTNQLFVLLVVVTVLWINATYYVANFPDSPYALIGVRFVMFFASAQIFSLFLFAHTFPSTVIRLKRKYLIGLTALTVLVMMLALSPFLFVRLEGLNPVPGPAIPLFGIQAIGLLLFTIYFLIRKMLKARGVLRQQLGSLSVGIIVTFALIALTNFILVIVWDYTALIPFTPALTLILIGSIAYAIAVHHLFDIRLIIRRTVVFSALLAFVFSAYTVLLFAVTRLFNLETGAVQNNIFVNITIALLIGFTFQPLREWIQEHTDRWLFKKEYEQQEVLKELTQKLNNVVALDEALESVMQTIAKVFHLHHAVTYVFQLGEGNKVNVKRVKQIGYHATHKLLLEDRDFTIQYFTEHPSVCLVTNLKEEIEQEQEQIKQKSKDATLIRQHAIKQAVLKKLESLEAAVVIPLLLNNQPLGMILISEQLSGENYTAQDLTLLDLVGSQAISSIQKAKLFEGDQMKSEFVSIASHELLTPISAIEGYLSMILDENIGHVDPTAKEYLSKVYSSAKRLSQLIKDLLSVSRIESGKMKIEPQQLDIDKMINDTLDQLKFVAADKKLEVVYKKPEKAMPPVWADPDRTMQVLVNLVGNSIKYTPKGSITISSDFHRTDGKVSVSIADTGIGMTKEAMSHLFGKFYRVDNPQTTGIQGTGLGLYITKSIIEKMGGTITVESVFGKGSTFTFTLPIFKVERSVAAEESH